MSKRDGLYGVGQESEQLAAQYLSSMGYFVIPISEYVNNTGGRINAPMVLSPSGLTIGPDLLILKDGKDMWVEVKRKDEPTYFWKSHEWQHGIDQPNFDAYTKIAQETNKAFIILIHEINSPATPDLWLRLIDDVSAARRVKADLQPIEKWLSISLTDASLFGDSRPGNPQMMDMDNPRGFGRYWPRAKMQEINWESVCRRAA